MTDTPIRTPAEALEAAAQIADEYHAKALVWAKTVRGLEHIDETDSSHIAAAIRALAPRIAAPDDEALVEKCARAMNSAWCYAPEGTPDWGLFWSMHRDQYRKQARAVLAALREAGGAAP